MSSWVTNKHDVSANRGQCRKWSKRIPSVKFKCFDMSECYFCKYSFWPGTNLKLIQCVRNGRQWISLWLKKRFLQGSLLFYNCKTLLPFHNSHPRNFYCIILSKQAGCSALIHLLQKKYAQSSMRSVDEGESCNIPFSNMKHQMLNIAPFNLCLLAHCGHIFILCRRLCEKASNNNYRRWCLSSVL